jgi:hypothetical protein
MVEDDDAWQEAAAGGRHDGRRALTVTRSIRLVGKKEV